MGVPVKGEKYIKQRLLEVRKALELSQKKFAEGLKIARTYEGMLEQRGFKINDRIVSLICMVYGVNEEWLKTGKGDMFSETKDMRLERVTQEFKKLDVGLQDYILKQIDWLLEFQKDKGIKN
jgi:transcriptional regulator with XRE-family HTH domain